MKASFVNKRKRNKYSMQEYTNTDRQLHRICQLIARVNRSYVPKKKDDSHTNLFFDPVGNQIMSRWVQTEQGRRILSLKLSVGRFEWLNEKFEALHTIKAFPVNWTKIEKEMAETLTAERLNVEPFFEELHYKIPNYDLQHPSIKGISEDGLKQWIHYRRLANNACSSLLGFLQSSGEARIWPHHFDTGVYTLINKKIGIGFGLAMKDSMLESPYFYLAAYPEKGVIINYDNASHLSEGHWEINPHWKGAVLPIDELPVFCGESEEKVNQFIFQALSWIFKTV